MTYFGDTCGVTFICSVIQWNIGEGQTLQQSVEELQNLLEKLGAKKSGLFVIECESFHSNNGMYILFA